MQQRIRAYADLARVHGISVTFAMLMLGAMTSTKGVVFTDAVHLFVIAFFFHISLNALNELADMGIDSEIPESSEKPLVKGLISARNAGRFIFATSLLLFACLFWLFPNPTALVVFFMSYLWLFWYCSGWGKRISYSFDLSFAAGYPLWALFGTFAVGGPTGFTWMLMVAIVAVGLFSQWENGLKDVEADRMHGVKSLAVIWNLSSGEPVGRNHTYLIYGIAIKMLLMASCIFAFLASPTVLYLLFILGFGIPTQVYTLVRFAHGNSRLGLRRAMLSDAFLTWILIGSIAVCNAGVIPFVLLTFFMVAGYLVFSHLESGAEWKFGRYSSPDTALKGGPAHHETETMR
ncbi:MAG: UbiA prenyltransferase family protein [Thermoplasmata archaeon]|nr:MAG: UbiA prenyltransferase family protein [Thermoplasmata archaeon]